jgi:hypothetical protein
METTTGTEISAPVEKKNPNGPLWSISAATIISGLIASASCNLGLVYEDYDRIDEVLTGDLQKSGTSSAYGDDEVWSYVKNYPG